MRTDVMSDLIGSLSVDAFNIWAIPTAVVSMRNIPCNALAKETIPRMSFSFFTGLFSDDRHLKTSPVFLISNNQWSRSHFCTLSQLHH